MRSLDDLVAILRREMRPTLERVWEDMTRDYVPSWRNADTLCEVLVEQFRDQVHPDPAYAILMPAAVKRAFEDFAATKLGPRSASGE